MSDSLSHINARGEANMVDVSAKDVSARIAVATGKVLLKGEVLEAISDGQTPKGDVIATARLAGIMGAKKTSELIPLCHQISLTKVEVDFVIGNEFIEITATSKTTDRTGVEMEALTAVSITALTLIDMVKAMDPYASITDIQVQSKSGGKSGDWHR